VLRADCAPSDAECQKCPFKEGCAAACGVEVPPAPTSQKAFVKTEKAPAKSPARINASEAEQGESYKLPSGNVMTFTGSAKGKFFFENEDGERNGLKADDLVEPQKAVTTAKAAPKDEEPKEEVAEAVTAGTAKADAWYRLPGHDDALQCKGTSLVKGIKRAFFESADGDRFSVELTLKIEGPVDAPTAASEEAATETEPEPPMPEGADGESDDEAMAELEKQLAARGKKKAGK
jgi:hypothetical protein